MRKYRSSKEVISQVGESVFGKSETVPDLAPSMRELLIRHANGITDNVSMSVSYTGDLPDLRGFEPHDLNEMAYQALQDVKRLQAQQEENAIALRKAQYEAKRQHDLELLKLLKEQENG